MEKRITAIQYDAGKMESTKRIVTFGFLLAVITYSFLKGHIQWNKDSMFILAFFGFSIFILVVSMAGYKKERIKVLSASNWKYRLYKRKGVVAYFIVRGVITSLLAITLFSLLMLRKDALNALSQKSDILLYSFLVLFLVAGMYHTLTIRYIFRNGTPVFDNVE